MNFNYKFRNINNELSDLENYDNISIQTDSFATAQSFRDFVRKITGGKSEALKLNIDTERFLTYPYVCVDQEAWNSTTQFENIQYYFNKYANILPADNSSELDSEKVETFSKWKYAKLGLTKLGMTLFSSTSDMNNYTILPEEYENQYFYTYIINLYNLLGSFHQLSLHIIFHAHNSSIRGLFHSQTDLKRQALGLLTCIHLTPKFMMAINKRPPKLGGQGVKRSYKYK